MIALLTLKHRQIEALLNEAEHAVDAERRGLAAARASAELLLHVAVEEAVFYPLVCRWATDVLPPRTSGIADLHHTALRADLAAVHALAPSHPGFIGACRKLRSTVFFHHRAEEADTFRVLALGMSAAEREALGEQVAQHEAALRETRARSASPPVSPAGNPAANPCPTGP